LPGVESRDLLLLGSRHVEPIQQIHEVALILIREFLFETRDEVLCDQPAGGARISRPKSLTDRRVAVRRTTRIGRLLLDFLPRFFPSDCHRGVILHLQRFQKLLSLGFGERQLTHHPNRFLLTPQRIEDLAHSETGFDVLRVRLQLPMQHESRRIEILVFKSLLQLTLQELLTPALIPPSQEQIRKENDDEEKRHPEQQTLPGKRPKPDEQKSRQGPIDRPRGREASGHQITSAHGWEAWRTSWNRLGSRSEFRSARLRRPE